MKLYNTLLPLGSSGHQGGGKYILRARGDGYQGSGVIQTQQHVQNLYKLKSDNILA